MRRGPLLNGHSSETNLPLRWSKSDNIAWKPPSPAKATPPPSSLGAIEFSSPLQSKQSKSACSFCLNRATGKPLWEKQVLVAPSSKNIPSTITPAPPPTMASVYVAFLIVPTFAWSATTWTAMSCGALFTGKFPLDARLGRRADRL